MKVFSLLSAAAVVGVVSGTPTQSLNEPPTKRANLPQISVSGNAFWADGKRFYLRGIDYQPGGNGAGKDPLADTTVCSRDIKHFKDLGVNTIRVYIVDNSKNHDDCMKALADAGIYLVLDVNNKDYAINRLSPHGSYNTNYLQNVFATVEEFAKYDNTLAFFSGNEVISDLKGTERAAPYVKAVTRDIKNYMNSQGLRKVPVGYSAADVSQNRMQTAMYMNCGPDNSRGDFFAFNDYSWCNSDFDTAEWGQKVKNFTDYGLPIFLSEWGCIKNRPRKFEEMSALMSDKMSSVYSGGLMFEYSNEENDFGIVEIKNGNVSPIGEFNAYKNILKEYPMPAGDGGAAKTTHSVPCPARDANLWDIDPSEVPTMPEAAEKFMKSGAGKGPGLGGSGSMNDVESGTSTSNTTKGEASPSASSSSGDKGDENAGLSAHDSLGKLPLIASGVTILFTLFGTLLL